MIPPGHKPGAQAPVPEGEMSHKQRLLAGACSHGCKGMHGGPTAAPVARRLWHGSSRTAGLPLM